MSSALLRGLNTKQSAFNEVPDPEHEGDFKKAYLKLVQKVYEEQGSNILITQDELEKVVQHSQFNLEEFNKRTQQALDIKKQKVRMMGEMKEQIEMQECTFKPLTYSQKQKRNFQ